LSKYIFDQFIFIFFLLGVNRTNINLDKFGDSEGNFSKNTYSKKRTVLCQQLLLRLDVVCGSIPTLWNAVLLFISNAIISEEKIVITSCRKHFCNQLLFAQYRIYMIS